MDPDRSVVAADNVVVRVVDGEAIVLHLETETYYGFDRVGTDFWTALEETSTIGAAAERLIAEFSVDPAELHRDLVVFITALIDAELITLTAGATTSCCADPDTRGTITGPDTTTAPG